MRYLDLTFPTPEQNLACDEALLDECEEGWGDEILRFWEPTEYFIVVGYSGKIRSEVRLDNCQKRTIPILRRVSGGGTVLQGPGCLNFSLVLNTTRSQALNHIRETNAYILERHQAALELRVPQKVSIQGLSDLTLGSFKFSGSAQRRKKQFVLFHGTFLIDFNIQLMHHLLPIPLIQPSYRNNRSHANFLTNINLPQPSIKETLRSTWNVHEPLEKIPISRMDMLVRERYANPAWNFKF